MAFPTTSVLDNFNRATENPLSDSGNWTNPLFSGNSDLQIESGVANQVGGNSTSNSAYRNNTTYGPDSEAYITLTVKSNNSLFGVAARIVNPNSSGATDGYDVTVAFSGGTDTIRAGRLDNDARTVIASASQEVSANDSVGLECNGSTITAYYKASGGSWTSKASTSDGTYSAAGNIGLIVNGTLNSGDDFGGGTIVTGGTSITPPVGAAALTGQAGRMDFGIFVPTQVDP